MRLKRLIARYTTQWMELTTVRARERVCTYGIPVAIGLRKHEGRATERKDAKGAKEGIDAETKSEEKKGIRVTL